MTERKYSLSKPMMIALSLWLCAHGHDDMNASIQLSTLVQCLIDLGILRNPPRRIWRTLKRTTIPNLFPACELTKWAVYTVSACSSSPDWMVSAAAWVEQNRPLLLEKRALLPTAPAFTASELARLGGAL